jgi:hypothetical protein
MIGETTNLHRLGLGHSFKPHHQWEICTDYNFLWADENTNAGTQTPGQTFSDTGNFRGHLLTCWAKYKFTRQLKGHLLAEYFVPGSYYDQSTRDRALFLRANIEYTF